MLREKIFLIFKHFRVTGGEVLTDKNRFAVTPMFLKGFSQEEIKEELYNMVKDDFIKDKENGILLTEKGENAIYGTFDMNDGINEISRMFQHFGTAPNGFLPIASFYAKRNDMLSPITNKHLDKVLDECESRGYAERKNDGLILKKRF